MALKDEPMVWVGLLVAIVALIWLLQIARRGPAKPALTHVSETPLVENPHESLLLQFVHDEKGEKLGETVALEGDKFVVKTREGFALVGTEHVAKKDGTIVVSNAVDWPSARTEGEAWRERSHKVITYTDAEVPRDEPESRS